MILLKIFVDMLTAHTIKTIQSLDKKKYRQKYNLFLVEGNKIIKELPNSDYEIENLYSVNPENLSFKTEEIEKILPAELKKISFLQHPKDSVAVCKIPENRILKNVSIQLVLDGIQDPGNLGTIIRLADWFGIEQIVCSNDTVDVYNPKVIQATMGSFLRVNVYYTDFEEYLPTYQYPILGTDMNGENIYKTEFPEKFSLIFGNEGNGLRSSTENLISQMVTIPRFGQNQSTESLNVSMSAGIILGEIFSKK
jgi:TrmH family RNA methyltransferase